VGRRALWLAQPADRHLERVQHQLAQLGQRAAHERVGEQRDAALGERVVGDLEPREEREGARVARLRRAWSGCAEGWSSRLRRVTRLCVDE